MAASVSTSEVSSISISRIACAVAAFLLVGCPALEEVSSLEAHPAAPQEANQEPSPPDTSQDDKTFTPLSQVLQRANDIILADTKAVSKDGKRITVVSQRSANGVIQDSKTMTIPHPRLSTREGFVELKVRSRFVYVLIVDAAGEWRTPEFGEESVFRVESDRILVPQFYRPGAELPANGPAAALPLEAFFAAAKTCHLHGEANCSTAIEELFNNAGE